MVEIKRKILTTILSADLKDFTLKCNISFSILDLVFGRKNINPMFTENANNKYLGSDILKRNRVLIL